MLVVLSGPPGAGKSTLAASLQQHLGLTHISIDALLEQKGGWSPTNWHEVRREVEAAVTSGLRATIDDDNHMSSLVKRLYRLAAASSLQFCHLVLDTPLEECLARNSIRPSPIPAALVCKVHGAVSRETFLPCSVRVTPEVAVSDLVQLVEASAVAVLPGEPDRRGSADYKHQADLRLRRLIHSLKPSSSRLKQLLSLKAECLRALHSCESEEAAEILSVTEDLMACP
jgi:predicted kinase